MSVFDLGPQFLRLLPPEAAHEASLLALESGLFLRARRPDPPELATRFAGLALPNPVGVAAGYDKDARVAGALLAMGCGFAEVGTLTPLPQAGNPQPRVFRLPEHRAVINRLGFNNGGHAAALARLEGRPVRGVVGVNLGANRDSIDRVADYVMGLEAFNDVASYFTINISSPNTPGLRDLEAPAALDALLTRLMAARADLASAGGPRRPIIVKLSPDMAEADIAAVAERLVVHAVDGIAVSNTTLSRPGLSGPNVREAGGLSGRPLFHRSTAMLARVFTATGGGIPLIGIGGIDSGETALMKIEAGATLLQLYTGLIYEGPGLIQRIKDHLAEAVRRKGARTIGELTGTDAENWAARPLG